MNQYTATLVKNPFATGTLDPSTTLQSTALTGPATIIPPTQSIIYQPQQLPSVTQGSIIMTPSQRSIVICSREDESRFLKELGEKNRRERIKQVREQEKEAARALLQAKLEKEARDKQKQEEEQRYNDYLAKKLEIEALRRMREEELERAGKAMRDAQEAEERQLREELEKKDKMIRDQVNMRNRGKAALERERQLMQEKRDLEEAIRQIERKRQVQIQESQLAHEGASKFRTDQLLQNQSTSINTNFSKMAISGVKSVAAETQGLKPVDYTNTRFHTAAGPAVIKHDQFLQEELEKLKKGAFDKAKEEQTKKSIQKAQKENMNQVNTKKAQERGQKALKKETSLRDKEVFEKEMKKLQVQEGLQKIKEGAKNQGNMLAGGDGATTALQEKKEKQKQEKMLQMFEKEVLQAPQPESNNYMHLRKKSGSRERSNQGRFGGQQEKLMVRIQEDECQKIGSNNCLMQQQSIDKELQNYVPLRMPNPMTTMQPPIIQQPLPGLLQQAFYPQQVNDQQEVLRNTYGDIASQSNYVQNQNACLSGNYPEVTMRDTFKDLNQREAINEASRTGMNSNSNTFQNIASQPPQMFEDHSPTLASSHKTNTPLQQNLSYQSNQNADAYNNNPFFVPAPSQQPTMAPPQNALPQYFNPYFAQHHASLQANDQGMPIQLNLHHPRQDQVNAISGKVEEFLNENREFLQQSKYTSDNDDSEEPDDYDQEDDDEPKNDQPNEDISSSENGDENESSLSSSIAKECGQIDRIIKEAKEQKQWLAEVVPQGEQMYRGKPSGYSMGQEMQDEISDSSSSAIGESFDEKYLQQCSDISNTGQINKQPRITSNLADEFLNDDEPSGIKENSSLLQSSSLYSQQHPNKVSYLKQTDNQETFTRPQTNSEYSKPANVTNQVFDYSQNTGYQPLRAKHQADLNQTPMSELSYSYSEMITAQNLESSQRRFSSNQGGPLQNSSLHQPAEQQQQRKGGMKLEIMDADTMGGGGGKETLESHKSLAEIFKERRGGQVVEERPKQSQVDTAVKKEKTKEELAEIRKQMMKPKRNSTQQSSLSSEQTQPLNHLASTISDKHASLMSRLAKGEKVEVSKNDMLKLTQKNYEQLPEVRKKREEERKKEEMKERMKQVKELERQRRELKSARLQRQ